MTANMHTFKYDKKMTSCEGCSKKFTTFLRRHHCRGCRGAYCHYCSKKKIEVPDWPGKQRVCDECSCLSLSLCRFCDRCRPPRVQPPTLGRFVEPRNPDTSRVRNAW